MFLAALAAARGFLANIPREVWYVLAAAALLWFVDHRAYQRGYERAQAEHAAAALKAQETAREADGKADEQRQTDNTRNQENEDARENAIDRGGRTGLNCQRLRAIGYSEADLPAACRS